MAQREITDCEPYRTLDDPTVSRWLKDALRASLDRDPVDAANDAEYLATILAERCALAPTMASKDARIQAAIRVITEREGTSNHDR